MAETTDERTSFPYMSANQWWGLRNRFKKSVPTGAVTLDWIMAALDTTQKGAGNVLPQLRLLGLTDATNKPTDLVYDFKDDDTYAKAASEIVATAYPRTLLESHDDPSADPTKVASWFGRNAKTGERAAINQAKLYLLILGATLPDPDDVIVKPKAARPVAKKPATQPGQTVEVMNVKPEQPLATPTSNSPVGSTQQTSGPTIHIDLQIHISADAGDAQIDSIFKSMAKHLYGK